MTQPTGDEVRATFPPHDRATAERIRDYAASAPFTRDSWTHIKWLYKQLEIWFEGAPAGDAGSSTWQDAEVEVTDILLETMARLLSRLDIEPVIPPPLPCFAYWQYGNRPSPPRPLPRVPSEATMAYMKRRGRRFMRGLSVRSPELYVKMAARLLETAGSGRDGVDLAVQWITADILYGGRLRIVQKSHGRGRYYAQDGRPFALGREEREPGAWDHKLDLVQGLYANSSLPWQVREMALKVLRETGRSLPRLNLPSMTSFIRSPSHLLIRQGVDALREYMNGDPAEVDEQIDPVLWAEAFFLAPGKTRQVLRAAYERMPVDAQRDLTCGKRLGELVMEQVAVAHHSRRVLDGAAFLAKRFPRAIPAETLRRHLGLLFSAGHVELLRLAIRGIRAARASEAQQWLTVFAPLTDQQRAVALRTLLGAIRGQELKTDWVPLWLRALRPFSDAQFGVAFEALCASLALPSQDLRPGAARAWLEAIVEYPAARRDTVLDVLLPSIEGEPINQALVCLRVIAAWPNEQFDRVFPLVAGALRHAREEISLYALGAWLAVLAAYPDERRERVLELFSELLNAGSGAWGGLLGHANIWLRYLLAFPEDQFRFTLECLFRRVGEQDYGTLAFFLRIAESLPPDRRADVIELLTAHLQRWTVDPSLSWLLLKGETPWLRAVAWQMIEGAVATSAREVGRGAWEKLLGRPAGDAALRSALTSPSALRLLVGGEFDRGVLEGHLVADTSVFTEDTVDSLTRLVGPAALARLTVASPADEAGRLVAAILSALGPDAQLAFWSALADYSVSAAAGTIRRLITDPILVAAFLALEAPEVARITAPLFGTLVLHWVLEHEARFAGDRNWLVTIATHRLPQVRSWGLWRAQREMDLPLALRLLESGLPEPVALGGQFIESLPAGDAREMAWALALCDSPEPQVQEIGRQFANARRATLPWAEFTGHLVEHPAPAMQAFVAQQLLQVHPPEGMVRSFDARVLRTRDRGRRAKELVKARARHDGPAIGTEVLLEVARGRTSRDAEWALQALARRSVAGEAIEGLSVDGIAGI